MESQLMTGSSVESTEAASASRKRRRKSLLWAHLQIRWPKCLHHSLFFG